MSLMTSPGDREVATVRPTGASEIPGHEYDGIKEYDNPTPGWWIWLFIATVVFSVPYYVFYHLDPEAPTIYSSWQQAENAATQRVFGQYPDLANDEATYRRLMADRRLMAYAEGLFKLNCSSCHAADGGGRNGPNLTDDYFIAVRGKTDLYKVITDGVGQAMPPWRNALSDKQRVLMAAYVASLRGTTPANPKSPEGTPIPPWPTEPQTDR
jgi:cytochrome c oxidase cbb3-type subunit 3